MSPQITQRAQQLVLRWTLQLHLDTRHRYLWLADPLVSRDIIELSPHRSFAGTGHMRPVYTPPWG